MNKTELIEALAPRLGGRAQAAAAVEAVVDLVLREVAAGRSVGITGFGTFEKVDRAPRTGRNPRTGEPVPIAGTSTPRFRPGAYFKDVVADPSALPPQGLAGARVGSDGRLERTGAPSSVRRADGSPEAKSGKEGTRSKSDRVSRQQDGAPGEGGNGRRADRISGTPESVRKDSDPGEQTGSDAGRSDTAPPATGRIMAGGEEITQGMIWAKKAQLARVQNDELAARQVKQGTKDTKAKHDGKVKKGKKGKKDAKVGKTSKADGKDTKKKKSKKSS
ncbi:HU family DNA-binding protein [Ornithinimicrobium sufpigmenti]|uniref:HU family DNA-binding protein n=1 Tax=Ornithinimicrobium sufpigmenti TaxID=2508882 RepID=UPI001035E7D0|nr:MULTISPECIES: HU family DNA-binding protein [unclassified Ornithinimicrobium]